MVSKKRGIDISKVKAVPAGSGLVVLKFEDSAQPIFTEQKGKPYILYGDKNCYPNYLLYLYNNSAKHSAIINGKVDYVVGKGWGYDEEGLADDQKAKIDSFILSANAKGETLKAITKKIELDKEIFNGYYLNIVWNKKREIASIYHVDYTSVRSNKENTEFYVSDEWVTYSKDGSFKPVSNPDYKTFPAYNDKVRVGSQILYVKSYHPGIDIYTLPSYRGSITWIEVDIEIAAYHLNNVKGGFFANKIVNFNNGTPTEEGQLKIEKMFNEKFAGVRGRKFLLAFNNEPSKAATVTDLNIAESDKIFDQLNKTGQQEIFTGHRVISPMLFGIKTEGQLGGRTELRDAYEAFQNTYVNGQQQGIEDVINMLAKNRGITVPMLIQRTEPIAFEFSEATQAQNMTKDEIREKMGMPPIAKEENTAAQDLINAINSLSPLVANKVLESMSSDEIRALVGLPAGVVPAPAPVPSQQSMQFTMAEDEKDADVFAEFGTPREGAFIVKSKPVRFSSDVQEALYFATINTSLTTLQSNVLSMLKKDPLATIEAMASALDMDIEVVAHAVLDLKNMGAIEITSAIKDGAIVVQRRPTGKADKIIQENPITKSVEVKYSYEGPEDSRNRAFCAKILQLDRLYTRKEIETISQRLGYSVWERRGGWYTIPGTNEHRPYCRHSWRSNIVVNNTKK